MKYKVGDKVKIVSKKTGDCWSSDGKMDKWLGKVMTIKVVTDDYYRMEEDFHEGTLNMGWHWFEHMVECKVSEDRPQVDYYTQGNIECIDYIMDKNLNFNLGNVVKYVTRAGLKTDDKLKDLEKAMDYLKFEIERVSQGVSYETMRAEMDKE